MSEKQNIEYKRIWKDEYLKWICGYANAQGGRLYIGKDDNGKVVGVNDSKKLLEDIPNKVRDVLGILVDVNLYETDEGNYIEIVVEPYPYAVNYKGHYFYRSGSTRQELKGAALDKFLLQKKGKQWDGVPIPNVSVADLKHETFDFFKKKGVRSLRLSEDSVKDTPVQLLENLKLMEGEFLKRAALLLFHPDPEKYVTGAYIKIGFFESDADLIFQDEVHGNLFEQIETTVDLLFSKYIKALISYEGISRVETYEYPKDAVREALLNAVAHKDYSSGATIQISVYDDKLMIWNAGQLPKDWTVETLLRKHASNPYNPDIANALFRSGYIESWGRGISKMTNLCLEAGLPKPEFEYDATGLWVTLRKDIFNEEHLLEKGLNERQVKATIFVNENGRITNMQYREINDCSRTTAARDLKELVDRDILKASGQRGAGSFYELITSIK